MFYNHILAAQRYSELFAIESLMLLNVFWGAQKRGGGGGKKPHQPADGVARKRFEN
jgi:hypothetical protein